MKQSKNLIIKKILITGYKKNGLYGTSSSETLLQKLPDYIEKFLFSNNYEKIKKEINALFQKNEWDSIIMLGQKPIIKKLFIEQKAKLKDSELYTNFPIEILTKYCTEHNLLFQLNTKPGNSYCNYAYYHILKFIQENKLKTKVIFIHIPYLGKIDNIEEMVELIKDFYKKLDVEKM